MRPMFSLISREFTAYFLSPVAYVTLFFFLLVTGLIFWDVMNLLTLPGTAGVEYPMQAMYGDVRFWLVFLFIPPMLTMRLFAEERGTGTLETLMTAPIRDWQVVAGKFIACMMFYVVLWLPTLLYLPVLVNFNWTAWQPRIDAQPVLTTYLGLFFAGGMLTAIGLLVSSLVKSQIVAALVALLISLGFIVPAFIRTGYEPSSLRALLIKYASVPEHFRNDFCRGIVDTRHLALYITATLFCLFLTVRSLEARRLG